MSNTEVFGTLLSVVDKVMDIIPNYEQIKKEKFYSLRVAYENEKSKEFPYRDDNLVGIYRNRLLQFISVFDSEISGQKISTMQSKGDWWI